MERKATAIWQGGLKEGNGSIETESGALDKVPYSFHTRFESAVGTNPEELIAAAHAACFSMALSFELEKSKVTDFKIKTEVTTKFEKLNQGWVISNEHLDVTVDCAGDETDEIETAAHTAKENCPVSRLLKANITMDLHINPMALSKAV